jgi:hypothetical protein
MPPRTKKTVAVEPVTEVAAMAVTEVAVTEVAVTEVAAMAVTEVAVTEVAAMAVTEVAAMAVTEVAAMAVTEVAAEVKKKRSRANVPKKHKTATEAIATEATESIATEATEATESIATEATESIATEATEATEAITGVTANKKRGRKPKGGKVIQHITNDSSAIHAAPNIILHLKCGASDIPSNDLTNTPKPGDVVSFNAMDPKGSDFNDSYQLQMNTVVAHDTAATPNDALIGNNAYNYLNDNGSDNDECDDDGNHSTKDILKKLTHLKTSFHRSDVFQAIGAAPRRSCCFWDTCEFDTPPVYLPKSISSNGGYVVYACFCSPECALAYLMNERIDTSVKFERCQMLNAMHGKVHVSVKPAPNPQYILSKFYGNLSIQEYRKLFKGEQIVYVVNKPLTHVLPEIYEENNDFMLNNKIIPTNNYKPKKKTSAFG